MFRTLKYLWSNFQKRPSKRSFLNFIRMMKTEIRCLLMTGYSTDEILKQSGGGIGSQSIKQRAEHKVTEHRGEAEELPLLNRFESCPDY